MKALFEKKLAKLLNRYLALDPESHQRLKELHHKNVTIELDAFISMTFQLHFCEEGITLHTSNLHKADTIIKGRPLSLLHLSLVPHQRKKFFEEDVTIEGNIELGQKVIALFDELEIDWEEYVSHWTGDIPAHHVGNFVKKIRKFSTRFNQTLTQNINEYIHEEINVAPSKEALEDFFQDIDDLRMHVDRLDAKFNRLVHMFEISEEK